METRIQSIAHLVVALYAMFLFLEGFRRRREIPRFNYVSLVNAGISAWNFLLFLYYGLATADAVYFVSQWGFVSVNVTIFGLFFFAWRTIFKQQHGRLLLLLALIPCITSFLSLTSPLHEVFLAGHTGFTYIPMRELSLTHGPWFIVHSVYSYVLIACTLALLIIHYVTSKRKNGIAMFLFVLSVLIFSVFLFLSNFTHLKGAIQQYAFLGHLFCVSVFYWATFLDVDESVIYYGKYRFYDTVGMPVLMFNTAGNLLHLNEEARYYLEKYNCDTNSFVEYIHFFDGSLFSPIDISSPPERDQSFFARNVKSTRVIYFRKADIVSGRGKMIGFSLTLYDLSSMDSFVKGLESRAYTDALCQCLNRSCFEERRGRILEAATRPLAIFIADIDNLKGVNDQWGHVAGDDYIRTCADIMKKFVCSTDNLYRIGGDEFIFFIPNLDVTGAERIRSGIEADMAGLDKVYPCGLSIGYSVLEELDMDFEKHFTIADNEMYRHKKVKKRKK